MQRVVRFAFLGLLASAGLAACGDKVTVPGITTTPPDLVVHGVTVSPPSVTLSVGQKVTLAASVDAGAGVTNRGVTWTSSNTAVATVGTDGSVTAVAAGSATIIAKSAADPNVQGAASVTVQAVANATVTISSINSNATGNPANLSNVTGQLDVIVNVDPGSQSLAGVDLIMNNNAPSFPASSDTVVATQNLSTGVAPSAEAAAAPVTLSFNTAAYNATTGAIAFKNGASVLKARARTAAGTQVASSLTSLTLNNADGVLVTTTTSGTSANDVNGLPWKSGNVSVAVTPVIYTGRTVATVSVTLPGLNAVNGGNGQTLATTTSPYTVSFPNSTSNVTGQVGQVTLTGGLDAAGLPQTFSPTVLVIDAAGNDIPNITILTGSTAGLRLDNQSPNAPTAFQIPAQQQGWINAAYTFAGVGGAQGGATVKYTSGGDAGVGNATNSNGINPSNTLSWFFGPAASFTRLGGGTKTGSSCVTTGLTQVATGNDIPVSTTNTAYIVRVLETDKLGNVRCADIGTNASLADGTAANTGTFGVDKLAPVANLINPTGQPVADVTNVSDSDPCPFYLAGPVQQVPAAGSPCGTGATIKTFGLGISDDASGFSATPVLTKLTRLNTSGGQTCVIGSGGSCTAVASAVSGIAADNATGTDGYYTYTATVVDLAQNAAPTLTRVALVDRAAPTMGGIAVPATITGGASAAFATSAVDNVDLVKVNYSLTYPAIVIRSPAPDIGVAFDNTLTTSSSFSLTVPSFIRSVAVTNGTNQPQAGGTAPTQIAVRVIDAAGNPSNPGVAPIAAANVPLTSLTNFSALQSNGATFSTFAVTNAATNISNGPTTPAANPTTVALVAQATGNEQVGPPAFQFLNPFTQVQFYYQDPVSTEWLFIGSTTAPVVTDNPAATVRTFTWTFSGWDPPASLPLGAVNVVALGVNAAGDALLSQTNANITLTNP
jgi:Big-like domain-containing protein